MARPIQFTEALPKVRACATSFGRWHVSGDHVYGKKLLGLLRMVPLAMMTAHILGKAIRAAQLEGTTVKTVKFGNRFGDN
jgi:hypothetical protein